MASTATSFREFYDDLWSIRDRRLDGWFMMDSPVPTLVLSASYVFLVTAVGPRLMRHRDPLDLKWIIQAYNVVQVALSAYIVYEAGMAGWFGHYNWICQDVERSSDPDSTDMRMASIVWVYFISKFVEFFDTFFFVARKKFGNVSALQVTHHGIMPVFAYCLARWLPGGQESFGGWMNSMVHVVMYTYYYLAALGPSFQKYLWWKKHLTTFQMIQFATVFTKSSVVILGLRECGYPWQFSLITASLMVLFFALFANFYVQEYRRKKTNLGKKQRNGVSNGLKSE